MLRLIVLLTATLAAPPAATVPAPAAPARPAAAQLAAPGMERGRPPEAAIHWRRSLALGRPNRGRLAGGVELPAAGTHFVTVDPVTGTSPNRAWRRNGTDRLLEVLLAVAAEHAAAHPGAPRLVVGDLSRPGTGLRGPGKVVLTLANHDDHLHVRIRPGPRTRR